MSYRLFWFYHVLLNQNDLEQFWPSPPLVFLCSDLTFFYFLEAFLTVLSSSFFQNYSSTNLVGEKLSTININWNKLYIKVQGMLSFFSFIGFLNKLLYIISASKLLNDHWKTIWNVSNSTAISALWIK